MLTTESSNRVPIENTAGTSAGFGSPTGQNQLTPFQAGTSMHPQSTVNFSLALMRAQMANIVIASRRLQVFCSLLAEVSCASILLEDYTRSTLNLSHDLISAWQLVMAAAAAQWRLEERAKLASWESVSRHFKSFSATQKGRQRRCGADTKRRKGPTTTKSQCDAALLAKSSEEELLSATATNVEERPTKRRGRPLAIPGKPAVEGRSACSADANPAMVSLVKERASHARDSSSLPYTWKAGIAGCQCPSQVPPSSTATRRERCSWKSFIFNKIHRRRRVPLAVQIGCEELQFAMDDVGRHVERLRQRVVSALFSQYLGIMVERSENDLVLHPWLHPSSTQQSKAMSLLFMQRCETFFSNKYSESHCHETLDQTVAYPCDHIDMSSSFYSPAGLLELGGAKLTSLHQLKGQHNDDRDRFVDLSDDDTDSSMTRNSDRKDPSQASHEARVAVACPGKDSSKGFLLPLLRRSQEVKDSDVGVDRGVGQRCAKKRHRSDHACGDSHLARFSQAVAAGEALGENRTREAPTKGGVEECDNDTARPNGIGEHDKGPLLVPLRFFMYQAAYSNPATCAFSLMSRCVIYAHHVSNQDDESPVGEFERYAWYYSHHRRGENERGLFEGPPPSSPAWRAAPEGIVPPHTAAAAQKEYSGYCFVVIARRAVGGCDHATPCFGNRKFLFIPCQDAESMLREAKWDGPMAHAKRGEKKRGTARRPQHPADHQSAKAPFHLPRLRSPLLARCHSNRERMVAGPPREGVAGRQRLPSPPRMSTAMRREVVQAAQAQTHEMGADKSLQAVTQEGPGAPLGAAHAGEGSHRCGRRDNEDDKDFGRGNSTNTIYCGRTDQKDATCSQGNHGLDSDKMPSVDCSSRTGQEGLKDIGKVEGGSDMKFFVMYSNWCSIDMPFEQGVSDMDDTTATVDKRELWRLCDREFNAVSTDSQCSPLEGTTNDDFLSLVGTRAEARPAIHSMLSSFEQTIRMPSGGGMAFRPAQRVRKTSADTHKTAATATATEAYCAAPGDGDLSFAQELYARLHFWCTRGQPRDGFVDPSHIRQPEGGSTEEDTAHAQTDEQGGRDDDATDPAEVEGFPAQDVKEDSLYSSSETSLTLPLKLLCNDVGTITFTATNDAFERGDNAHHKDPNSELNMCAGAAVNYKGRALLYETLLATTEVVVCAVRESRAHHGFHDRLHRGPTDIDHSGAHESLSDDESNHFSFYRYEHLGVQGSVSWLQGELPADHAEGAPPSVGITGVSAVPPMCSGKRKKEGPDGLHLPAARPPTSRPTSSKPIHGANGGSVAPPRATTLPLHAQGVAQRHPRALPEAEARQWRNERLKSEFRLARSRRLDAMLVDSRHAKPIAVITLEPLLWSSTASKTTGSRDVSSKNDKDGANTQWEVGMEGDFPHEAVQSSCFSLVSFSHYVSPLCRYLREEKAILVDMDRTLLDNAITMSGHEQQFCILSGRGFTNPLDIVPKASCTTGLVSVSPYGVNNLLADFFNRTDFIQRTVNTLHYEERALVEYHVSSSGLFVGRRRGKRTAEGWEGELEAVGEAKHGQPPCSEVLYVRPGIRQLLHRLAVQWGIPLLLVTRSARARAVAAVSQLFDPGGVLFARPGSAVLGEEELRRWSGRRAAPRKNARWALRCYDEQQPSQGRRPRAVAVLDDSPQAWEAADWPCTVGIAPFTLSRVDPEGYLGENGYIAASMLSCLYGSHCVVCPYAAPQTWFASEAVLRPQRSFAAYPHCVCSCPALNCSKVFTVVPQTKQAERDCPVEPDHLSALEVEKEASVASPHTRPPEMCGVLSTCDDGSLTASSSATTGTMTPSTASSISRSTRSESPDGLRGPARMDVFRQRRRMSPHLWRCNEDQDLYVSLQNYTARQRRSTWKKVPTTPKLFHLPPRPQQEHDQFFLPSHDESATITNAVVDEEEEEADFPFCGCSGKSEAACTIEAEDVEPITGLVSLPLPSDIDVVLKGHPDFQSSGVACRAENIVSGSLTEVEDVIPISSLDGNHFEGD